MNIRRDIGSRLRHLRKEKGLTTRELAVIAGLGYSHISKIENGTYDVRLDTLDKMAAALGAKIDIIKK